MNREEILQAYKRGALTTKEVLEKLRSLQPSAQTPLSVGQLGLWVLQQMPGSESVYNMPVCLRVRQTIDFDVLERAYAALLAQHPILKSVVDVADGKPFQRVSAAGAFDIRRHDLSGYQDAQALELLRQKSKEPFILKDCLIRMHVASLAKDDHLILIVVHHIIFDGGSLHLLLGTLVEAYDALQRTGRYEARPPQSSYAAFVEWEQAMLASVEGQSHRTYWERQLSGELPTLTLPSDRPRSPGLASKGRTFACQLSKDDERRIGVVLNSLRVTRAVFFLGIYQLLLHRYTGERDIIVGIPTAGRLQPRFESLIGYFVNTIAVRSRISDERRFSDFIKDVHGNLADGLDHAAYPFANVVRDLRVSREVGQAPVFQVAYEYQNESVLSLQNKGASNRSGLVMERVQGISPEGEYELVLEIIELEAGLTMHLKYDASLYEEATIRRMAGYYLHLVSEVLKDATRPLSSYTTMSRSDALGMNADANSTAAAYPANTSLHALISEQAKRTPHSIAMAFEDRELTYAQLDELSDRLALHLRRVGVQAGNRVGLCVERSLDLPVGLLGILKAGAAYVPLDPSYPRDRLGYMLADSAVKHVVTQSSLLSFVTTLAKAPIVAVPVDEVSAGTIVLDDEQQRTAASSSACAHLPAQNPEIAYVMYTSGSTGDPKGVVVSHRSLINFLYSMKDRPGLRATDRLLAVTTYSFDISGLELYLPLLVGATCCLCAAEKSRDVMQLAKEIARVQATVMQATPTTWSMLLHVGWRNAERLKILCGGEAMPVALRERFVAENWEVWNLYGPTETTIWSTLERVTGSAGQSIGKPIANTQIYILDSSGHVVPNLVIGEIHIGGHGLALGYLNQPKLTAEKFIDDPLNPGDRLYRTGDLGYWRADGAIGFVGRKDSQVKLRGYRIEIGEIEAQMCRHPSVQEAVVIEREEVPGQKQLVAYVVARPGENYDEVLRPVSFSLFYFGAESNTYDNKYELYLRAAKFADANGLEAVWTPERHFDPVGGLYPSPAILSGVVAATTNRVQVRAGSVVLPLHHPVQVAEEWSIVDNLSSGRAGVALASGWVPRDFVTMPQNFAGRKQLVSDGIATIRRLWRGDRVTFPDGNGANVDVEIFPKPIQKQLPMWMTSAGAPETFIEAGRLGVHVLTNLLGQRVDELAEKIVLYRDALAKNGFDPQSGRVTVMVHTYLGSDSEQAIDRAREPFIAYMQAHLGLLNMVVKSVGLGTGDAVADKRNLAAFAFERYVRGSALIGSPEDALKVVNHLRGVGVDEVACLIDWMDTEAALDGLEYIKKLQGLASASPLSARALRAHCGASLPDYMIPARFVELSSLPLTPNGKVDRKRLASTATPSNARGRSPTAEVPGLSTPQTAATSIVPPQVKAKSGAPAMVATLPAATRSEVASNDVVRKESKVATAADHATRADQAAAPTQHTAAQAPEIAAPVQEIAAKRSPDTAASIEKHVQSIWQQALGIDDVGVEDNFFIIGGHSLAALTVADQIKTDFKCDFNITDIFRFRTVRQIAQHLSAQTVTAPPPKVPSTSMSTSTSTSTIRKPEAPMSAPAPAPVPPTATPPAEPAPTPLGKVIGAITSRSNESEGTREQETANQVLKPAASKSIQIEQRVLGIWQQALGIEDVGPDDNFFIIGGHSLAALAVADQIKTTFACDFKITDIFRLKTVREIAQHLMADAVRKPLSSLPQPGEVLEKDHA